MSSQAPVFNRYDNYECKVESKQITALFNQMVGQMLTIIEASISDPLQRTALKSVVKDKLWSNYEEIQNWMYNEQFHSEDHKNGKLPPNMFPY